MLRDDMMRSLRLAGQVKRYHTWPTLQKQTVADHTWQVMRIYTQVFGPPLSDVWEYILLHDVAEMWTGDIPFPAKARNPNLAAAVHEIEFEAGKEMGISIPDIGSLQRQRVKICDLLEMWEFGMQEMSMGNQLAQPIASDCMRAAMSAAEIAGCLPEVENFAKGWSWL